MDSSPPAFADEFAEQFELLLRWRRDVRHFKPDRVPDGAIDALVASADLGPSVGLSQPWRFVRVTSPTRRQSIIGNFERCNADALDAYEGDRASLYAKLKLAGLKEAPEHLAVFAVADPEQGAGLGRATMPETIGYSVAIAVHTLWLKARISGIGVGWVSILDPSSVNTALDIDPDWQLVAYLCIGFPAEELDTPELERKGWEHRQPSVIIER